jgi:hypothetical protein
MAARIEGNNFGWTEVVMALVEVEAVKICRENDF